MKKSVLILYSRVGCCLCEGLEQRLREISLERLHPPLTLFVIDIDSPQVSDSERARYELKVPVMCIAEEGLSQMIELPRVSPRLNNEGLFAWFQKVIPKSLKAS